MTGPIYTSLPDSIRSFEMVTAHTHIIYVAKYCLVRRKTLTKFIFARSQLFFSQTFFVRGPVSSALDFSSNPHPVGLHLYLTVLEMLRKNWQYRKTAALSEKHQEFIPTLLGKTGPNKIIRSFFFTSVLSISRRNGVPQNIVGLQLLYC